MFARIFDGDLTAYDGGGYFSMDGGERPLDEGERGERTSRKRKGAMEADLQSPL